MTEPLRFGYHCNWVFAQGLCQRIGAVATAQRRGDGPKKKSQATGTWDFGWGSAMAI